MCVCVSQAGKAKGSEEKHIEEVEFAKFKVFCDETREEMTDSIAEGEAKILQLEVDTDEAESDVVITGEIADLKEKAEAELTDSRKAETNGAHNYNMLKGSLEASITNDEKNLKEEKAKNAAIVADATGAQAAIKVLKDFYGNLTGAAVLQSMNQAASLAQGMRAAS